ncbi:MAG: hypothetical protein ACREP9_18480, partial [Candidatus Dormibacteraceae bacterium]
MQRSRAWLTLEFKEVVMVWKQDLAKLKQALGAPGGPPPPPIKPKPRPVEFKSLQDEDAAFLAAMGAPPPPRVVAKPTPTAPVIEPTPLPEINFETELAGLKGLKPLGGNAVLAVPSTPKPATVPLEPAAEAIESTIEIEAISISEIPEV